jgi:N-methylhydantoinase A
VWFAHGWRDTPVYRREALPPDLEGPAIIEQLDCTIVLEPGNRAAVDALGNLVVEV